MQNYVLTRAPFYSLGGGELIMNPLGICNSMCAHHQYEEEDDVFHVLFLSSLDPNS